MLFSKNFKIYLILGVSIFLTASSITVLYNSFQPDEVVNETKEIEVKNVEEQKTSLIQRVINTQLSIEPESETPEAAKLLLPDLSVKAPTQLYIAGNESNKQLRFDTTFVNSGPGALEIIGHADPESGLTHATQYIYAQAAPGEYRNIGSFELHPTHNHWHVANHVRYQLWSVNDQGLKNELVVDTGKYSFCLWDEAENDLSIENASQNRVYGFNCDRNTQGISVGWSDTYRPSLDGQELNITNIPDGNYFLIFEVNPDQKILEVDYENNRGELELEIKGFVLTLL
jgi:hypothetical protein